MRIPLSIITSEIARTLSLKHHKKDAYRILSENGFHVLVGLCVQPETSLEFSVNYYIQGLYVPFHLINLSLGDWIGRWERTDISTALPVIKDCYEHLPYDSIATIIDRLNNRQLTYRGATIRKHEFLAYSYLAIEMYDEAKSYLNKIVDRERDDNYDWVIEVINNARTLLNLLEHGEYEAIREQLLSYQQYTMTELKLPEQ